jgi:hypothetical protein
MKVNRGVFIYRITIPNTKITVTLNTFLQRTVRENIGIKVKIDHKINDFKITAFVIQHLSQHKTIIISLQCVS